MRTNIFINLPVKDLQRSMGFFKQMGYSFDMRFTDDKAACLIIGEDDYTMLVTEPFFQTFTPNKQLVDATKMTEALIALSAESREKVDEMADKAIAAGGKAGRTEDQGFMYGRSYEDLDGHIWEYVWMDMSHVEEMGQQKA